MIREKLKKETVKECLQAVEDYTDIGFCEFFEKYSEEQQKAIKNFVSLMRTRVIKKEVDKNGSTNRKR